MSRRAAFRLYKSVHAATAMTGDGAKKFGGRWNHEGLAVVYCSSSLALAQLETLVHLNGPLRPGGFESLEIDFPSGCWKVGNVLEKGDVSRKAGDDYPARIYITFEYDSERVGFLDRVKYEAVRLLYGQYPPLGAINYIWESKAPVGTVVPNPFTGQVVMFVLESGPSKLNTWVTERRNVYEDYKAAFGEEPPMISGVAIMTDTDNTGESATAYFGDIVFKKASP